MKKKRQVDQVKGTTPAEEARAVDAGLAAIYGEERDDLAKLDQAGSRVTRILSGVVLSLLVVAALALVGFLVYMKFFATAKTDPLTLQIEVPDEVASGTSAEVKIHYKNEGRVPLANLVIDANVPIGFVPTVLTPVPTDAKSLIFTIGSVPTGGEGEVDLQGTWLSTVPGTNTVQALATYRPANFNADFDAVATASVSSQTSNIGVVLTGPDKASPGEMIDYKLTLTNNGELASPNLQAEMTVPSGFVIATSDPVLTAAGPVVWALDELAPQATQVITLHGSWSAEATDVGQLIGKVSTKLGDVTMVQGQASVFTNIVGNGLRLSLVGNGATGSLTLDPGDPLRLTVGYENTSETAASNVSLLVDFAAVADAKIPIDWQQATLDGGKLTPDGIAYDAKTVGTLQPQDSKVKNLIFPVAASVASGQAQTWTVVVHASVNGVTISSQPLTITLNSDTHFTAAARYFNAAGAPVGTGSLPPKVGQQTQYNLLWSVSNTLHALDGVRVSATLPPGVAWQSVTATDTGTVSYDDQSRVITWTVASLPAATTAVTANFEVSVTPEVSDAGTFMKLLSGSAFRATDDVTKSSLQQTGDILTTECSGDDGVAGKGYVAE